MSLSWARAPTSAHRLWALNVDLAISAGVDDVSESLGVVGVDLVGEHVERALGVAGVEADHW